MARHKRRAVGLFVRRSVYVSLWVRYTELLEKYRALEADLQAVLEDHEGLLYDMESPAPLERNAAKHTPSWAETEEIPVVTGHPMDPDKAAALTRKAGLLRAPSGAWSIGNEGTTG